MMARQREPVTPAVRQLRAEGVEYRPFIYDYRRFPGALGAAEAIGVEPHLTVKTIVFRTGRDKGALVLMNGDREVSAKSLARVLAVKSAEPASAGEARRWTGYQFGGTSPFGTRRDLPTLAHREIADMAEIYINAGSRGFVVAMRPADLIRVIEPRLTDLAV